MQVAHHFEPHLIRVEMAGADARDRLDVRGDAFFDPVMIFGDGRERQVDHLVREHPIAGEIGELRVFADVNGDEAAILAAKSAAAAHTFSVGRERCAAKVAEQGSGRNTR